MKARLFLTGLALSFFLLSPSFLVFADDKADLTALLSEFLDGATRNDGRIHNKFWAEELIYTSSSGSRFGKTELMQSVNSSGLLKPEAISTVYDSEDLHIMQYGNTAVVAFVLIARSEEQTKRYLNSGTFIKRNGQWQAVNWQATIKAKAL